MAVGGIEQTLISIHQMLAVFVRDPAVKQHIIMQPEKARAIARAAAEVSKYYKVPMLDPKYVALAGLVGVTGKVYRDMAMDIRRELPKGKRQAEDGTGGATGMEAGAGMSAPATDAGMSAPGWLPTLN